MSLFIQIRKLEKSDLDDCIALFRNTVHSINIQDYNQSQLDAWAPEHIDKNAWWESLSKNIAYVAEYRGQIVGFGDMSYEGYFDRLYVHKDFQRKGVASTLIKKMEEQAMIAGIQEVHTEVSITAKPLMEAFGYQFITQQVKEHNGQKFVNYIMKKSLKK
jgi:putative acetyltransferase